LKRINWVKIIMNELAHKPTQRTVNFIVLISCPILREYQSFILSPL